MAGGNVLSVEGLTKRFGERLIFEDLHFGLDQGQKAALVARNGTGKSTLMKVLLGIEGADAGTVTFSGQAKIAHLSQEHGLDVDRSLVVSQSEIAHALVGLRVDVLVCHSWDCQSSPSCPKDSCNHR